MIVPLDHGRLDMLAQGMGPAYEGFTYLGPELEAAIGDAVGSGPALYVETDYSGGSGTQGAAYFEAGKAQWRDTGAGEDRAGRISSWLGRLFPGGAAARTSPISRGLAELGVRPSAGQDAFDAVGLGRFRSMQALGLTAEEREP